MLANHDQPVKQDWWQLCDDSIVVLNPETCLTSRPTGDLNFSAFKIVSGYRRSEVFVVPHSVFEPVIWNTLIVLTEKGSLEREHYNLVKCLITTCTFTENR